MAFEECLARKIHLQMYPLAYLCETQIKAIPLGKFGCAFALQAEFSGEDGGTSFAYVDKVRTYPVFCFGGVEGTKVCTLAFQKVVPEHALGVSDLTATEHAPSS